MKSSLFVLFFMMVMLPLFAFAQVVLPGEVDGAIDISQVIEQLIANPKAFLSTMGGALLILLFVQACKKFGFKLMKPEYQLLLILFLGQVYSVLVSVFIYKQMTLSTAIVGFFSSGAAISLFNQLKLAFPKLLIFEPKK